ncbi:hypothetical protein AB833_13955 [Chromatiales bacterium (ex Bugula neritina AB1)]|nr:hypothetical protein AB833_13955 [Chromatiales bacterium (ex Bugula neritina AB1)]
MIDISVEDESTFQRDGLLVIDRIVDTDRLPALHRAFDELFSGRFETGVRPDEVNWQNVDGDPSLTRQISNGWKANREIASVVLDENIARAIAELAGWSGVRIMIDNVLWKPVGVKSLGYHQDSAYLSWFTPSDLLTCWIALDETSAGGGTMELVRGSHRWAESKPAGDFHAPEDYRLPMREAAAKAGVKPDIVHIEVPAGGGSFHHGWTWHGSGQNSGLKPRRALVLHAMQAAVEYDPLNFNEGIGPIYSRYKRLGDNHLDENYFPILWREDGYRTPQIADYLNS